MNGRLHTHPLPLLLLAVALAALSACGAAGGVAPVPDRGGEEPPLLDDACEEGDGPLVTVRGRVAYERLVLGPLGLGPALETRPAAHVDLQVRGAGEGPCYGRGSTDAEGAFVLAVRPPAGAPVRVWALSRTLEDPVRRIVVHDGLPPPSGEHGAFDVFHHATDPFDPADDGERFLLVPYRRDGPQDRPSIGFGILDVLVRCDARLREATDAAIPTCHAYTRVGNNGATGTSFYEPDIGAMTFLGGAMGLPDASDTDYFDDAVIAHEYGHFVESALVHTLSRAGTHAGEDLEPGFAWSEGQATAFGCLCRDDPRYVDTLTTTGGVQFDVDVEDLSQRVRGIGSEETVAEVLWDLGDGAGGATDLDGDRTAVPLARLYAAFLDFDAARDAPYLGLFLERLVERGDVPAGDVRDLLRFPEEQGLAFPLAPADVWPVPLAPSVEAAGTVDATVENPCRARAASRWYALDLDEPANVRVDVLVLAVPGAGDTVEVAMLGVDGAVRARRVQGAGPLVLGPLALDAGRHVVRVAASCEEDPPVRAAFRARWRLLP